MSKLLFVDNCCKQSSQGILKKLADLAGLDSADYSFASLKLSESKNCVDTAGEKQLLRDRPEIIVALGASVADYLLHDKRVTKLRGRMHEAALPTRQYRLDRVLSFNEIKQLAAPSSKDPELIIAEAVSKHGFGDLPTRTQKVFVTFNPSAIVMGNRNAEVDILTDLNYLAFLLSRKQAVYDYTTLNTLQSVQDTLLSVKQQYLDGKIPYVTLDIETTSLNMYDPSQHITTIAMSWQRGQAVCIPWEHRQSPFNGDALAIAALKIMLNDFLSVVPVVGHNLKFDYKWLFVKGIYIKLIYDDTELMSWTLWNDLTEHALEPLSTRHTDLILHKQEMKSAQDSMPKEEKHNTNNYDLSLIARYNCFDTDATLRLCQASDEMLITEGLDKAHKMLTVASIIPTAEMELNGCALDIEFMDLLKEQMDVEIADYLHRFEAWGLTKLVTDMLNKDCAAEGKKKEFNLSSAEHKSKLLFDILGMKPTKYGTVRKVGKDKGKKLPSVDKKVIAELLLTAHTRLNDATPESAAAKKWTKNFEVLRTIQDFSIVSKLYSGYVIGLPKKMCVDGFVRPIYGIRHTATGRYNCRNPSLHTIPWHSAIKKCFISRFLDGVILSADQSQMELRFLAIATQDPGLIEAFVQGKDLHRVIAAKVLGVPEDKVPEDARRRIKTVNFGIVYGRGAKSIAAQEGMTNDQAQDLINSVMDKYPGIKRFIEATHKEVVANNSVRYMNGFRRLLERGDPKRADRQGVNSKIQGPASDVGVLSLINAKKAIDRLKFNSKIYQFVHDSIGYDVAPGELYDLSVVLSKVMAEHPVRTWPFLTVPLKVDMEVGSSWGTMLGLKFAPGRAISVSGKLEYYTLLTDRLMQWTDKPTVTSYEEKIKEEPKMNRSVLRTDASDDKVQVKYVTATLSFPPLVKSPPLFLYKPCF